MLRTRNVVLPWRKKQVVPPKATGANSTQREASTNSFTAVLVLVLTTANTAGDWIESLMDGDLAVKATLSSEHQ